MSEEPYPSRELDLVILSGLSGSGKSTAAHALEDLGFFVIDNLPVLLLPRLLEMLPAEKAEIGALAVVVDAREGPFLEDIAHVLETLRGAGVRLTVVFLECRDEALLRRYSETRRRHPMAAGGTVEDGIRRERSLLLGLAQSADWVVDTSDLNPHQLKELVEHRFARGRLHEHMRILLISFGYRYGLPAQADLVFDARFLPNPYFVPELRNSRGIDPECRKFVMSSPLARLFLEHVSGYLSTFLPQYDREGKSYLTLAVGCTGGRHRSVAMVEEIAQRLPEFAGRLVVRHRDLDRG
jgi:UPF0042 nucleotide-binding protein